MAQPPLLLDLNPLALTFELLRLTALLTSPILSVSPLSPCLPIKVLVLNKSISPQKSPSPVTCFYCKEPEHIRKDCPKPGCKVSKPRRYGNNPTIQKHHNLRRNVNQVNHDESNEPQVNSVIDFYPFHAIRRFLR
ncbi:hypothetical protein P9112_002075 [Eukaryota sp. TZLM1-RC]